MRVRNAEETLLSLGMLGCAAGVGWIASSRVPLTPLAVAGVIIFPVFMLLLSRNRSYLFHLPLLAVLFAGILVRVRDATALAQDPLDGAALYRAGMMGLALVSSAAIILLFNQRREQLLSPGLWLYFGYIGVVFTSAWFSISVGMTSYRGLELLALLVAALAGWWVTGAGGAGRSLTLIYWFITCMLVAVWINGLLLPTEAWVRVESRSPLLPWQLTGVAPALSSNSVGFLGVVLLVWSLSLSPESTRIGWRPTGILRLTFAGLGLASLLAAQYRTGYVALALAGIVHLVLRKRLVVAVTLCASSLLLVSFVSLPLSDLSQLLLRGESVEQAEVLSGRTEWWRMAIPVWKESPLLGKGLLTATRYEILLPNGFSETSTIHSTWLESLVGTGIVGTTLLLMSFLITYRRSYRWFIQSGDEIPILLLTMIAVRSPTGSTIETYGLICCLYVVLMFYLASRQSTSTEQAPLLSDEPSRTEMETRWVAP